MEELIHGLTKRLGCMAYFSLGPHTTLKLYGRIKQCFYFSRTAFCLSFSPFSSVKSPYALPSQCGIMGDPYKSPHSGPPCHSFQKRLMFQFCANICASAHLCKQTTTRNVKDWTGAFWGTKHWPWSSWYRKTLCFKSIPLVSVRLFVDQTVGRDLSDMREEAVCSGTYISLTTSSLHINADGQQRLEWTKGIIYWSNK